jgi:hypothetical protein
MREYIVVQPELGDTSDPNWVRIWLNGHAALGHRLVTAYHIPSTWRLVFIFEVEEQTQEESE